MKEIISKELLSEVLKNEFMVVDMSKGDFKNNITMHYKSMEASGNVHIFKTRLNVYELAHKCKEWAFKQDKYRWLFSYKAFIDCWCDIIDNHDRNNIIKRFSGATEPEAIFKACQWILDNKDIK